MATHECKYREGTQLILTAHPNDGYDFIKWVDNNGALLGNKPKLTYTVDRNVSIEAVFEKKDTGPNIMAQCEPKEGGTINVTNKI